MRRAFTQAGMWGLLRVESKPRCAPGDVKPLDGLSCTAQPSVIFDPPELPRPGEPAPGVFASGGGQSATPSRPTTVPAAAAAPGPRGLRVKGSVGLGELSARGMRMELLAPAGSRVVDLRLSRVRGKRLVPVLDGRVRIRRGGPIVLRWKPGRAAVARLRTGTYVVRVRVGPDARRLSRRSARITVRLTGRAPAARAPRRR